MRSAPPAGRIGRVSAVRRPTVCVVLLKPIIFAYVLGITHRLEYPHIFTAREDICAFDSRIDFDYHSGNEFFFVEICLVQPCVKRLDKVSQNERLVRYILSLSYGYHRHIYDKKVLIEKILRLFSYLIVVVENMKRIKICVLRINSVPCKTAAQTVGSVVHSGYRRNNSLSVGESSAFGKYSGYRAPRRYSHLAFFQHNVHLLKDEKASRPFLWCNYNTPKLSLSIN